MRTPGRRHHADRTAQRSPGAQGPRSPQRRPRGGAITVG